MQPRQIVLLVILTCWLSSCISDKHETPEETAKLILNSLKENDIEKLSQLMIVESDSLTTSPVFRKELHRFFTDTSDVNEYVTEFKDTFKEVIEEGKKVGINWTDVEFKKFDFELTEPKDNKKFGVAEVKGKIVFISNKREFHIRVEKIFKMDAVWKNVVLFKPVDIVAYREKLEAEPYQPIGLTFTRCDWEWNYTHDKSFKRFYVTIKNGSSENFDYVKYRITIHVVGSPSTEVFSKTMELNEKILSGDVLRFEIIPLRDFYVGKDLTIKANFDWEADVLDAKPRPDRSSQY